LDIMKLPNMDSSVLLEILAVIKNIKEIRDIAPFINLLRTRIDDLKIQNGIISLFKSAGDERCIKPIIELARKRNTPEEILELYLSALGEFLRYFRIKSKFFKKFLHNTSNRVRQSAVWCLSQYRSPNLYRLMTRHYRSETSLRVRIEIIKALQHYPVYSNAKFLFNVLKNSTEGNEKLLSESSLASLPLKIKSRVFRNKIKNRDSNTRALAIRQISTLNNPRDVPLLLLILKKDKNENVREQAAEVLGLYENKEIDEYLYNCIKHDESIAYSAMLSICQSYHTDKQELFIKMLDQNIEENILMYQTILSYLPNHFKIYKVQPSLIGILLKKLKDENANIRYLTTIALGETGDKSVVQSLINSYEIETVKEIKKTYIDSIIKLIGKDYDYLLDLLKVNPKLLPIIVKLIFELDILVNQKSKAIQSLFLFSVQHGSLKELIDNVINFSFNDSYLVIYLSILFEEKLTEDYAIKLTDYIQQNISGKVDEELSQTSLQLYKNSSHSIRGKLCPILSRSTGITKNIFALYKYENDIQLKSNLKTVLLNLSMR
ncbi:MAG: HEAT repeat domain-containing protein, partial [Chitinispirillia bacterium]